MAGLADDDPERWAYLAEGNRRQARKRVAVDVVIRDQAGRVLIVNPTYKEDWDLPGGMAEENEPPRKAAERELREELGLTITAGRLLTLDWVEPHGPWDDQLVFVFDAGILTPDAIATLRAVDEEISDFRFADPTDCARLLRPDIAALLTRALHARDTGETDYREHST
ncbi:NUDIX domain-containing protein [Amycolatopsis sp. lyj-112]|uniref:NUDIX domain-containing protein n=1 Tax=Amycolatopsis sp. lyj-112 TaxID=2789288 RepID=UPI00397BEEF4